MGQSELPMLMKPDMMADKKKRLNGLKASPQKDEKKRKYPKKRENYPARIVVVIIVVQRPDGRRVDCRNTSCGRYGV